MSQTPNAHVHPALAGVLNNFAAIPQRVAAATTNTYGCAHCGRYFDGNEALKAGDPCPSDNCPSHDKPLLSDRLKTAACLLFLLIAYGFVGQMDYENEVHAAAFECEQRYGQQAAFTVTSDGWECQRKATL